jgi:hypothetical protein
MNTFSCRGAAPTARSPRHAIRLTGRAVASLSSLRPDLELPKSWNGGVTAPVTAPGGAGQRSGVAPTAGTTAVVTAVSAVTVLAGRPFPAFGRTTRSPRYRPVTGSTTMSFADVGQPVVDADGEAGATATARKRTLHAQQRTRPRRPENRGSPGAGTVQVIHWWQSVTTEMRAMARGPQRSVIAESTGHAAR